MIKSITVGIPVFNGQETIERAIKSLLRQKAIVLDIVVLDNASTDCTTKLVQDLAVNDPRIRLYQNRSNIGAFNNFKNVLSLAAHPYFMFLGADDYLEEGALSSLANCLEAFPSAIAVTPFVFFLDEALPIRESVATKAVTGTYKDRLLGFLKKLPNDNSRFYSLYRKYALQIAFDHARPCHGADWVIVANALKHGDFQEDENSVLYRQPTDIKNYAISARKDNAGWISLGLPMLPFAFQVIRAISPCLTLAVLPELFRINLFKRKQNSAMLNSHFKKV